MSENQICKDIKEAGKMKIPTYRLPWSKIAVDYVGRLPKTKRHNEYMLVVIDTCTGWPEIFPLKDSEFTSVATIDKLLNVFCHWGFPNIIVSDNGSQFISAVWELCMDRLGVKPVFTTPYHPQANRAERKNRCIKAYLKKFAILNHRIWEEMYMDRWIDYWTQIKIMILKKITKDDIAFGCFLGPVNIGCIQTIGGY